MRPLLSVVGASVALALAACTQSGAPAPSATVATSRMHDGPGCQGEIERYRAIMTNDLAMGHVNQSVYGRVEKDIERAQATCTAGRDGEARRMIEATKARYGYS